MSPITVGIIFLGIGFIAVAGKFLYTGLKFTKYIKERYPEQWDEMVNKNIVSRALFPFKKGTLTHFVYKSTDSLNDEKIVEFRRKFRQHFFLLFVIYPLSFLSFVVLVIFFLETDK